MSSYNLNQIQTQTQLTTSLLSVRPFLDQQWWKLVTALVAVLLNSATAVVTPFLISVAIDQYISQGDLIGLNWILISLLGIYLLTSIVSYTQTRLVGQVSQVFLFRLRNQLFSHLQELPLAFFQDNSGGDIIARINNDTDKINNFLGGSIFQFISSLFTFVGIGVFIFWLNWQLSLVVWSGVIFILMCNYLLADKVKKANKQSLDSNGQMSGFLDENLNNFKALVAFNQGSYLNATFANYNQAVYRQTIWAQVLNGFFNPLYSLAGNVAQVAVLSFGLYLLSSGHITLGLLVGFISYSQKFYEPLRTLGNIWGSLQEAVAAWGRIESLLNIK